MSIFIRYIILLKYLVLNHKNMHSLIKIIYDQNVINWNLLKIFLNYIFVFYTDLHQFFKLI